MSSYLIDSNTLIEANNRYYGIEFCPAFWDWLVAENRRGKIASINKVAEELSRKNDAVSQWTSQNKNYFLTPDDEVENTAKRLSDWAHSNNFRLNAISDFLKSADYWLIAFAQVHNCIVVTQEIPSSMYKKIKIPTACEAFKVSWMNTFQMLRIEQPKFVLEN